ncbi:metabotropic glutamate receptor 4-like [Physella acuta]|uniref:metabotropic glutamate receptor 4-like n=1 Tax=Physella acuta TaxID=109671 RepID=UPI0027DB0D4C|nr:metabotropic glutamate receptor 4-like [Physella acuta]
MRIRSTCQEYHLLMLVLCQISLDFTASDNIFVGLNTEVYKLEGDINLGALYSITEYSTDPDRPGCSKTPRAHTQVLERIEATMFAVRKINNDKTILPNVTLGMYIVDYCILSNMALARALSFLPGRGAESIINTASTNHYDVVGVVGLSSSEDAIPVSSLYSSAQLPLISFLATSDYLSNKDFHSYFLRVVPSDAQRVNAMMQFITDNGWSFISVVYDEGEYGEAAFYTIKKTSDKFGVCVAASLKINSETNFAHVIEKLLMYRKARIVIMFTSQVHTNKILETANLRTTAGHFIWIGSDGLEESLNTQKETASHVRGSFNFKPQSSKCPEFTEYFNKLLPGSTSNPWLPKFFEIFGKCSLEDRSCNLSKSAGEFSSLYPSFTTSLVMDSVATYADAIHRLLKNLCPNALGKAARNCIKRDVLRQYLLNASFDGITGRIEFDEDGNLNGRYEIEQFVDRKTDAEFISDEHLVGKTIGFYNIISGSIEYIGNNISWEYFRGSADDAAPAADTTNLPPDSACSRPCTAGEYPVPKEIICCWDCRKCRQNEIVVNNGTHCEPCATLFWPDEDSNFTSCSPITATFTNFSNYIAQIEICVAVLAIMFQVYISIMYVNLRESSIIKTCDRELSAIQMMGIFLGYVTVILFQAKPTVTTCTTIYVMFSFSFSLIYDPLLVKTVKLYRIFQSQEISLSTPLVISTKSQLLFASTLISLQTFICLCVNFLQSPTPTLKQPVATVKFVELYCHVHIAGIVSFLSYNVILVFLCSIFAFKTRSLPENFSESKFISMCVFTTLVIWLSFICAYVSISQEQMKVVLLCVALLLNHTVALLFLFLPKIYAAVYIEPTALHRPSMFLQH